MLKCYTSTKYWVPPKNRGVQDIALVSSHTTCLELKYEVPCKK